MMRALAAPLFALVISVPAAAWQTQVIHDPMGTATARIATVSSKNVVEFGFPYQRPQHAVLALRDHPRRGRGVLLQIERGQFVCGVSGCSVLVRFDEGKAQTIRAERPADHSSTILFLGGPDSLMTQIRRAKTMRVEAAFYKEGAKVFEFDVSGLGRWPDSDK